MSERVDAKAFTEMHKVIWQTETQDFGGYSTRDAEEVARRLWDAGYRKVERFGDE